MFCAMVSAQWWSSYLENERLIFHIRQGGGLSLCFNPLSNVSLNSFFIDQLQYAFSLENGSIWWAKLVFVNAKFDGNSLWSQHYNDVIIIMTQLFWRLRKYKDRLEQLVLSAKKISFRRKSFETKQPDAKNVKKLHYSKFCISSQMFSEATCSGIFSDSGNGIFNHYLKIYQSYL